MDYSHAVVFDADTGAIGGSGGGAVALRSADAIDLTVINRHNHNPNKSKNKKIQKNQFSPHRKANRLFGVSGAKPLTARFHP
ncbi:hypothetical protein [Xanthomonas translucens]|uniref:hypothetical protein n=1 Tax=Xanthomonas campestris pv. translucens TaxID=343 RepID=UPI001F610D5A|nr:hypothetical protein [Xanthomonas translucens]